MSKARISVIAVFLLLAFGAAFAASNSTKFDLASAATVAGQKLQPGTYKVTWTGTGDNVAVVITGHNTQVKTTAKATENNAGMSSTSYVTNQNGELTEIRPAGKSQSLTFTNDQNASTKTSPSSAQ
jgi:hypothetical protein